MAWKAQPFIAKAQCYEIWMREKYITHQKYYTSHYPILIYNMEWKQSRNVNSQGDESNEIACMCMYSRIKNFENQNVEHLSPAARSYW